MARSLADRIDDLDAAIQAIEEGGQDVTVGGQQYRAANYKDLCEQLERLQVRYARQNRRGVVVRLNATD